MIVMVFRARPGRGGRSDKEDEEKEEEDEEEIPRNGVSVVAERLLCTR